MLASRFSVNDSLWVRGDTIDRTQRNARSETDALRARGASVFMLKSHKDVEGIAELKRQLHGREKHVILSRLMAAELKALYPLLRERKNFSIVVDDWWCMPNWFMRTAEYIIFRNYNGIAARLGQATLVDGAQPPLLLKPPPPYAPYNIAAAALRIPALAAWPFIDLGSRSRRSREVITPERFLYFPFPISDADVPLKSEKLLYDFANTGGTCGIWLVRDPFASAKYTFANLYYDRQRLTDFIGKFENNPFSFYDCRRGGEFRLPFDQYATKNRQSRFVITTGGLHNTSVPNTSNTPASARPRLVRFSHSSIRGSRIVFSPWTS